MRARLNLALYPARERRRTARLLLWSLALAVALTAAHLMWATAPAPSVAQLRGDTELLRREAAVQQERLADLRSRLDEGAVRELADRVAIANELIARAALDPVELLALLETQAPESLVVERLLLTGSPEGTRAELTVSVTSQGDALELIRRLRGSQAVREVTPVREQVQSGGGEVELTLLYRPPGIDPGDGQ